MPKHTAAQIVAQGGDYLLARKDNHAHMHEDVRNLFAWATKVDFADLQHATDGTLGKDHGRIETRSHTTISDPACRKMVTDSDEWTDLRTVVHVHTKRQIGDTVTEEERYYLSSLAGTTPRLATVALNASRSHWGIENQLHWGLDVAFKEDHCRARAENAGENFAVLRHFALNLLRREKSARLSVRAKRLKAAWDDDYLRKILAA